MRTDRQALLSSRSAKVGDFLPQIKARARELGVSWRHLVAALPIEPSSMRTISRQSGAVEFADGASLRRLLGLSTADLLRELGADAPLFSYAALSAKIEAVEKTRGNSAAQVYSFARSLLDASGLWPRVYDDVLSRCALANGEPVFQVGAGILLDALSDSTVRVHVYGTSKSRPAQGDVFVHPQSRDFGFVRACDSAESGATVTVRMLKGRNVLRFVLHA